MLMLRVAARKHGTHPIQLSINQVQLSIDREYSPHRVLTLYSLL